VTTALMFGGISSAAAQASGTVDVGGSWVDYEGFLGTAAASVSPTLRYDAANTSLGASANLVLFESGRRIVQGLAAGAWRTPIFDRFLAEISGSAGVNVYEDNPGYGHMLARTRFHVPGESRGFWLGAASGQSFQGSNSSTPIELEIGGWTVVERAAIGAIATKTWNEEVEYVDIVGSLRWRDVFLEIDGTLGFRGWSDGGGEGLYGELHARVPIWRQLSVLVSGGRYPSDPVRGVVSANYITAGLRIEAFSSPASVPPSPLRALFRELERPGRPGIGEARLTVHTLLESRYIIRVEAPGARAVELIGDFTDWQPLNMVQTDRNFWELSVSVSPGVHRVNVRLDGGSWIVPGGLRAELDDFGGSVGVLVVR